MQKRSTTSSGTKSVDGLPGLPVVAVVVLLPVGDVVGQRLRDGPGARPVSLDEVSHVVADHATEPPHLLALVIEVLSDIGRARRRRR